MLMAMSSLILVISVIVINHYCNCTRPLPRWLDRLTREGSADYLEDETVTKTQTQSNGHVVDENGKKVLKRVAENADHHQEQWKKVLAKLDKVLFYVFFTVSVLLFIVVFTAISILSSQKPSSE